MRNQVQNDYIQSGSAVEGLLTEQIYDIDNGGKKDAKGIQVLGGILGQLMIVLNTVALHEGEETEVKFTNPEGRTPKVTISPTSRDS